MAPKGAPAKMKPVGQAYKDKSKPADVRSSNINAAKGKRRNFIIIIIHEHCSVKARTSPVGMHSTRAVSLIVRRNWRIFPIMKSVSANVSSAARFVLAMGVNHTFENISEAKCCAVNCEIRQRR